MKKTTKDFLLLMYFSFFFLSGWVTLHAEPFTNGDFSNGKSHWEGEGHITFLNKDGTIDPCDGSNDNYDASQATDGKTPILEIDASHANFKRLYQNFNSASDAGHLLIQVVYKVSPGFKRNSKYLNYTTGISSEPGDYWYTYCPWFYPRSDLFVRLDSPDGVTNDYHQVTIKMIDDWQTLKTKFGSFPTTPASTFNLYVAPGEGSLYIKSISVTNVK